MCVMRLYLILFATFASLRTYNGVRYPKVHSLRAHRAHELSTVALTFCHEFNVHLIGAANRRERPWPAVPDPVCEVRVAHPRHG